MVEFHDVWHIFGLIFMLVGVPIILFIRSIIVSSSKKIDSFPSEPPFKYQTLGGLIKVDSFDYDGALHRLTKKAKKMGADSIKNFEMQTIRNEKKDEDTYIMMGVPIKKI